MLLDGFLSACRSEGRSPQALSHLRNTVPKLFTYLQESSLELLALKARDAQGYIGWLQGQTCTRSGAPYASSTVAVYFEVALSFYEYLRKRGVAISNPFREARRVRVAKRIPKGLLKENQMESLLDEMCRFDEQPSLKEAVTCYKLHVVCELMYATGMRVGEVASLRLCDIEFAGSTIKVREAKGGYPRVALLSGYAREVLRLYVERMRAQVSSRWNLRNGELLFAMEHDCFAHA
jgi:site-specific recombinase XerD